MRQLVLKPRDSRIAAVLLLVLALAAWPAPSSAMRFSSAGCSAIAAA